MLQVKRPSSLTVGPRQKTKLDAWCSKGSTVTTTEHMHLGLSALAADCVIVKLALIPETGMINIPDRNIMLTTILITNFYVFNNMKYYFICRVIFLFVIKHTHTHTQGSVGYTGKLAHR